MKKYRMIYFIVLLLFSSLQTISAADFRFSTDRPIIPVLVGKDCNPVFRINLLQKSALHSGITSITFDLTNTSSVSDIAEISLYGTLENGRIDYSRRLAAIQKISNSVNFETPIIKDTSFWVAVKLKDKVCLDHKLCLSATSIECLDGTQYFPNETSSEIFPLRIGYALRQKRQDGIASCRIPGITTSLNGTLLAVFDVRYDSPRDLQGNIDIGMHRSFDGGETWTPLQIVLDRGRWGNLEQCFNGISDANILVDEKTGRIFISGLWMYGMLDEHGKWIKDLESKPGYWIHQWNKRGSQKGFSPKKTCQFLMTVSDDDGITWSAPKSITRGTKQRNWWLFAPCPGHGITLDDGTLVIPTQGRDKIGNTFSNFIWSKNGGRTWKASAFADTQTTECNVVQLSTGAIMLNMRNQRSLDPKSLIGRGRRIFTTEDLGKSWRIHPTSDNVLPEPVCMGSIHKHKYLQNGEEKSILLFSNPDNVQSRDSLTLKVSMDDGLTWPEENQILFDQYRSAGYSSITSVDESHIGILYESNLADLVFLRIPVKELITPNK